MCMCKFLHIHAKMWTALVAGMHVFRFPRWWQIALPSSGAILLSPGYCFSTPTHSIIRLLILVNIMDKKGYLTVYFYIFLILSQFG